MVIIYIHRVHKNIGKIIFQNVKTCEKLVNKMTTNVNHVKNVIY
jgi:hypothetical protein